MANKIKRRSYKGWVILLTSFVIILAIVGALWLRHRDQVEQQQRAAAARVTANIANHSSHVNTAPVSQGAVSQTSGNTTATTPSTASSQWKTSASGVIKLQEPLSNTTLLSGDTIAGTASISTVQYRLIDNSIGVIAQGSLQVVNGAFSGTFNFQHQGSSGQLDIFSYSDGGSGSEINSISIPVEF